MNKTITELQQEFRQLWLAETAEALPKFLRQAKQSSWTYQEVLEQLTAFEVEVCVFSFSKITFLSNIITQSF